MVLEAIATINQAVNNFVWGIPAMVCIIGVGLLLSVRTGFLQIRKFPYAIKTTIGRMFRKKDASDGAMTPFQAVCTALAGTVGTGNIAGVAGAIAIGGPGAVFWMWCSALLGMCTKFAEVTLAVHFRERSATGEWVGGPMYYIKNGLGKHWQFLAVLYSLFGVLTVFGTGNATQVNTIVAAIDTALTEFNVVGQNALSTLNLVVGIVVAMLVAMVLLGGIKRIDIIYLCYPNNPTGTTLTKPELKKWVDYALANDTLILFDAAYEAFIQEDDVPHSIYEIKGAKKCAIEFRSFSKTAGFTGVRCGYTVVPKELTAATLEGERISLNKLWNRRQCTKFNGTSYITQRAAEAIYTPEGKRQIKETIGYYMNNARTMKEGLEMAGLKVYGGVNAPYIWLKTPNGVSSWKFFEQMLYEANVVGTPGVGFGPSGEGYIRLTAFGTHEDCVEAMRRIRNWLI